MRGILSFIVVLGALFDIGHCQTDCSNGYLDENTGTCYKELGRQRNWTDSRAECQRAGGDLASIKTSDEWQLVKGLLQLPSSGTSFVWLGGSDEDEENNWVWTDGSPVTISDWGYARPYPNQPANNCMWIWSGWSWRMGDGPCSDRRYALCKIPATTSPAPTNPPVTISPSTTTCPPAPTCPTVTTCPTTIPESLLDELKNIGRAIEDLKEQNEKLSEVSMGMTLEEYEAKETQCSAYGNFFDIKTGYCYKYKVLKDTRRKWNEARTQCKREDGDLAAIKSRQEWEVVKGLLKAGGTGHVWLGGTDEGVEGTWMWIDGSPVTFSYWYPGNPSGGSGYNCMAAFWHLSWRWFITQCSSNRYAVCKIPVEA